MDFKMNNRLVKSGVFSKITDPSMIFAIIIVATIMMLIIPMPTFMLDFFMVVSILSALIIVLTVAYIRSVVEFSIFPTLLLVTTIFRMGVNVSSTRLILSQGTQFDGKMVRAFGQFVVGTNDASGLVIGVVIFAILTLVQFIVITKGASRVSEVAARFSLDSMQNKFMAIDMDVQNGIIDEDEAIKRRGILQEEYSFFGNMDGASKFVQGDVIMGIIITFINVIGGLVIGMVMKGEDFNTALNTYVSLTIGDGLVAQIPSLLISFSTGLIVTRSSYAKDSMGTIVWKQISSQHRVFYIAGAALLALALLPGFPHLILVLIGAAMIAAGYFLSKREQVEKEQGAAGKAAQKDEPKPQENFMNYIKVDPLSLYIGCELIPLVRKEDGAELLTSILGVRRNFAMDLGIVIPQIRIQDNLNSLPNEYSFLIKGQTVGKGFIKIGCLLAFGDDSLEKIDGEPTIEPAFNLPALWIKNEDREKAESLGYTVVDPPSIISTHIQELLKANCHDILGREQVKQMVDNLKADYPSLVEAYLQTYNNNLIFLQKVLQQLLKEGVSVRDLATVMETMGDYNPQTSLYDLVEAVRGALKRVICNKYADDNRRIYVLRLNPKIENEVYKNISIDAEGTPVVRIAPVNIQKLQMMIKDKVVEVINSGHAPVILTEPAVRRAFWEICQQINRNIVILSSKEIIKDVDVVFLGQIGAEEKIPAGSVSN